MVWNARISPSKKLGLGAMFCGGIITAVFGGLRCGYVLQNSVDGPQLAGEWSCRESFVAVFISNIPVVFPIIHRNIKKARNATSGFSKSDRSGEGSGKESGSGFRLGSLASNRENKKKFKHPLSLPGETFYERYGSEEEIISQEQEDKVKQQRNSKKPGDTIEVTKEWQVRSRTTDTLEREQELRRAVNGFD